MTKTEAAIELLRECRIGRNSTTAARRIVRACRVLGIDHLPVLVDLDYCDPYGTPYSNRIERVW